MKRFEGFPARMEFSPVPRVFINQVMPRMTSAGEIKALLYVFNAVYQKKGSLRFVSYSELAGALSGAAENSGAGALWQAELKQSLAAAVDDGLILALDAGSGPDAETLYFVNGPFEREAVRRVKRGEMNLEGVPPAEFPPDTPPPTPDIFTLYEANIGQLTPMIAEELKDALATYPEGWIADAIKIAVTQNRRNWHYVSRILERWTAEGKKDGTYKQDTQVAEQDRYIRGRYGPLIQR